MLADNIADTPTEPTEPYEEKDEEKCEICGEMSDDVEDGLCADCREAMDDSPTEEKSK